MQMARYGVSIAVMLTSIVRSSFADAAPVQLDPTNPHYFNVNGVPVVFVTTDHHYGAVIDMDFDYVAFLDTLQQHGMNLTRIYPGAFFEPFGKYIDGNPLGPADGRQILPWARTTQTGADPRVGGLKFDLDTWDETYFARLRDFVIAAGARGIVVEIAFFNGNYADCWPLLALYHRNNINGVGNFEDSTRFTTLDSGNLSDYQANYVAEITRRLNDLDNIIYDICDEPQIEGQSESEVGPWIQKMIDAFVAADTPNRHVLGQTVHSLSPDFTENPAISWIPSEYLSPMAQALDSQYADNKPIVDVETGYWPPWYDSSSGVDNVRVESWEFIVGGAAGFIHLNGDFSRSNETGAGTPTESAILPQKRILKDFIHGFDFVRMAKFDSFSGVPGGAIARAIAEPGRQYALYIHHSSNNGPTYIVTPGSYSVSITLQDVPAGSYTVEWVDPAAGTVTSSATATSSGGPVEVQSPQYSVDIALRMLAEGFTPPDASVPPDAEAGVLPDGSEVDAGREDANTAGDGPGREDANAAADSAGPVGATMADDEASGCACASAGRAADSELVGSMVAAFAFRLASGL